MSTLTKTGAVRKPPGRKPLGEEKSRRIVAYVEPHLASWYYAEEWADDPERQREVSAERRLIVKEMMSRMEIDSRII